MMILLGILSSFAVQLLVDSVLIHHESSLLNAIGIGMISFLCLRIGFGGVRQYLLAHMSRRVNLQIGSNYVRHILRMPAKFFESRRVGEITSRLDDVARVCQAISGTILGGVMDSVTLLVAGVVLWFYDNSLAAIVTGLAIVHVAVIVAIQRPAKRISRRTMEDGAELSSHLIESVGAVNELKSFCLEGRRSEEAESRFLRLAESTFSAQKLGILLASTGLFIGMSAQITTLWLGGHRVITGVLTIGQLMFFNTLLMTFLTTTMNTSSLEHWKNAK